MPRDSLRATLDDLRAHGAAEDRPYLEAMLRRLGYTEREIRDELGPMVEADGTPPSPPADTAPTATAPPTTREFRLVVPARESAFWVGDGTPTSTTDEPFEALERVDFEPVQELEFEPAEDVEFVDETGLVQDEGDFEVLEEAPFEEAPVQEAAVEEAWVEEAPVEEFPVDEPAQDLAEAPLDTFGGPDVDTQERTRVRVKRVRARSREEAEAKVASKNRRVIKSIPVDIVERWGGKQ